MRSFFFFSSRRRHTRFDCDWSSDVCSSDLRGDDLCHPEGGSARRVLLEAVVGFRDLDVVLVAESLGHRAEEAEDRKSTRLNSSHSQISYAVFCLKKKIFCSIQ